MSDEIVRQNIDYAKIIQKQNDLESLIKVLAEPEVENQTKKRISSRESKVSSWFGKQDDLPAAKVKDLRQRMMNFVDDLFAQVHVDEARELTPEETHSLMAEFLDAEDFKVVFEARRKATKAMIFNHLTAENIKNDVPEPDNHNGYVEVPKLGKKFCREGTGRGEPFLDEEMLKILLGADWNDVVDKEEVPSYIYEKLNEGKLMALCRKNPELLEKVRDSLQLGSVKTPRFQVRDM